jgi:hypothetical protein
MACHIIFGQVASDTWATYGCFLQQYSFSKEEEAKREGSLSGFSLLLIGKKS